MVNDSLREPVGNADGVQNVGVQRVPRQADGPVYDESRGRRLSIRSVLLHDAHVQAGTLESARCKICRQGLEGALEAVTERGPRRGDDEVAQSGRADEEGAAPPPRVTRPTEAEKRAVLWR